MRAPEQIAITRAFGVVGRMAKPPTLTLQLAYIEWKHGDGAEAAMEWIASYLEDNDLVPTETGSEEFFREGQALLRAGGGAE